MAELSFPVCAIMYREITGKETLYFSGPAFKLNSRSGGMIMKLFFSLEKTTVLHVLLRTKLNFTVT